ncbi:MAG: hypothetical protein DMD62_08140 [Gemmatimonadetes bacterium]|nr:MAG: hypothetical protein DMD62_08140 [Gemmatimonadota bacterium]
MPVTARLSRKFYERFGDDLTNELVEWFNQVDTTYRSEFRDLFDVNFARFDAKLEQRIAELRAELHTGLGELRAELRTELGELRAELHTELGELRGDLTGKVVGLRAELESKLSAFETRIVRWMFLFWVGTVGTLIALLKL